MPDGRSGWKLEAFLERLDRWAEQESPADDVRMTVTEWILSRYDDPYRGVRRAEGFGNLWSVVVPRSDDGFGRVVVCSYWIEESTRTVRCDGFATLSRPI